MSGIDPSILNWIIPGVIPAVKGDVEGHEFHGNQYSSGGGSSGGGSDSGGGDSSGGGSESIESKLDKIAEHNRKQDEAEQYHKTHVKPNDKVTAHVHTSPMAEQAKKPKVKVTGRITTVDTNESGEQIARIEFEHGGKQRSAWINIARDKWQKS